MPKPQQEETIPFSLRLTKTEHTRLKTLSAGMSMASYVREKIFGSDESRPQTRGNFPVADHTMLSQLLAVPGKSRTVGNDAMLHRAVSPSSPVRQRHAGHRREGYRAGEGWLKLPLRRSGGLSPCRRRRLSAD